MGAQNLNFAPKCFNFKFAFWDNNQENLLTRKEFSDNFPTHQIL